MSAARIVGAPEYIAVGSLKWRKIERGDSPRAIEDVYKLRRASRPRRGDVFLVLGDIASEGEIRFGEGVLHFADLAEVTWAADRVFDSDLCYRPVRWK